LILFNDHTPIYTFHSSFCKSERKLILSKVLKSNGFNGFLVGNKLSLADIGLLECVLLCDELIGADSLKLYPEVEVWNLKRFF